MKQKKTSMPNPTMPITTAKKVTRQIGPSSKFKTIPIGYEEFYKHPHHGGLVGRCLTASRRHGVQCGAPAVRLKAVCYHHSGKGSGARTLLGEASRLESVTKHGNFTKEKIAKRKTANKELLLLKKLAYATGLLPWNYAEKDKPKLKDFQHLLTSPPKNT